MRENLLAYLRCPLSGGDLELEVDRREGEEVLEGTLVSASGLRYPVEDGIPNLVVGSDERIDRTADQFAHEFLQVGEVEDRDSKLHRDITLFFAKTGIDPGFFQLPGLNFREDQDSRALGYEPDYSFLEGKLALDAGCGDGRFAKLAAPHAREMILLDLGEQIHKAKEVTEGLGNVHCVRCNLLHLPVREEVVDFAYSIGVIHHTPDPTRALREIARTVADGGWMSVWVYPPEYWGNPMKRAVTLTIRKWLLSLPLSDQVEFIRRYLMPLGRFQLAVSRHKPLKYVLAPLFLVNVPRHEDPNEMEATVIDYYLPEYIRTYRDEELADLFRACGMSYRRLPFPTSGRGQKSVVG